MISRALGRKRVGDRKGGGELAIDGGEHHGARVLAPTRHLWRDARHIDLRFPQQRLGADDHAMAVRGRNHALARHRLEIGDRALHVVSAS